MNEADHNAQRALSTHDPLLAAAGLRVYDSEMARAAEAVDGDTGELIRITSETLKECVALVTPYSEAMVQWQALGTTAYTAGLDARTLDDRLEVLATLRTSVESIRDCEQRRPERLRALVAASRLTAEKKKYAEPGLQSALHANELLAFREAELGYYRAATEQTRYLRDTSGSWELRGKTVVFRDPDDSRTAHALRVATDAAGKALLDTRDAFHNSTTTTTPSH